jgi:hypothetical protein
MPGSSRVETGHKDVTAYLQTVSVRSPSREPGKAARKKSWKKMMITSALPLAV